MTDDRTAEDRQRDMAAYGPCEDCGEPRSARRSRDGNEINTELYCPNCEERP